MANEFKVYPVHQTLVEQRTIDDTRKYIEIMKSKSYNYRVKLIKKDLKKMNREGIVIFNSISMNSGKAVLPIMNLIIENTNRHNMLCINRTTFATTTDLVKLAKVSRPTVTKYIKKLVDKNIIKRHDKNFMLSPYIFYPNIDDFNLKILQEYWDNDFKKSKESIASEIQVEINSMLEDAKEFVGASRTEFEQLQSVKKMTR